MRYTTLLIMFFCSLSVAGQEVPFMHQDMFELELDYQFETKPLPDPNKVSLVSNESYASGLLPYVKVNFNFVEFPQTAFKIRVVRGKGEVIKTRKVKNLDNLEIDMGFSDDIKDRVTPYLYTIYFLSKSKEALKRIKLYVEKNGDFYLNDQLFGKI